MWVVRGKRMFPLLTISPAEQPWHSSPYQALPEVFSQNASLEIAWTRVVFNEHTIAGNVVIPFFTQSYEGFDVNHPYDWELAEKLVATGEAQLPKIDEFTLKQRGNYA
jgi:CMP-N,N'-diacetyllegionaminic acid synthase